MRRRKRFFDSGDVREGRGLDEDTHAPLLANGLGEGRRLLSGGGGGGGGRGAAGRGESAASALADRPDSGARV